MNGKSFGKISEIFGIFPAIGFVQRDDAIILGSPDDRRRFLDFACSLDSLHYYHNLLLYQHTLRQRNHQIRNDILHGRRERSLWNAALIGYGSLLSRHRMEMLREIEGRFSRFLDLVSEGKHNTVLQYRSCYPAAPGETQEDAFARRLEETVSRENVFRTTVVGPHREVFSILNNRYEMHDYCSQGEARLAALALKLALVAHLGEKRNIFPVLLFDDVLIELDEKKTAGFLEAVDGKNQRFFTSTTVPDAPYFRRLAGEGIFTVEEGKVKT